ncbi:MAG: Magnesium transporter MgtE [Planctomycetota bacterium]|jgi:magnesium transporter
MVTQTMIPPLDDLVEKHMHREVVSLKTGQTVAEALESIRGSPSFSSRIIYFYVVDHDGKLQGIMATRALLLSQPEKLIDDLMVRRPVAIPSFATIFDACEFFTMYKFLAFPVVNEKGTLVGMLDIRTYNAEMSSMNEDLSKGIPKKTYDDLFQLIGVHWEEAKTSGIWSGFSARFPWLVCNVLGGLVAAFLLGLFEYELEEFVVLALFIPVVLALAESVAIQSVSISLQSMHDDGLTWKKLVAKLYREVFTGVILGIATALLVVVYSYLLYRELRLVGALLIGISGGVTCAAAAGQGVPSFLKILKMNPQVAAGPIALVCADMAALLFYLLSARFFFG